MKLPAFMNRKVHKQSPKPIRQVGATGLAGEPTVRQLQAPLVGIPTDRATALVGYGGGWTMGAPNLHAKPMNGVNFGNTDQISARNF